MEMRRGKRQLKREKEGEELTEGKRERMINVKREGKERKTGGDREIIDFYPILLSHPAVVHFFIYLTSSSSILIFSQISLFVYLFLFLSLVVFSLFSLPSHPILYFTFQRHHCCRAACWQTNLDLSFFRWSIFLGRDDQERRSRSKSMFYSFIDTPYCSGKFSCIDRFKGK